MITDYGVLVPIARFWTQAFTKVPEKEIGHRFAQMNADKKPKICVYQRLSVSKILLW